MNLNQTLILKDNRTLGYAEAGNPTGKPQLPPTGIKIESLSATNASTERKFSLVMVEPTRFWMVWSCLVVIVKGYFTGYSLFNCEI